MWLPKIALINSKVLPKSLPVHLGTGITGRKENKTKKPNQPTKQTKEPKPKSKFFGLSSQKVEVDTSLPFSAVSHEGSQKHPDCRLMLCGEAGEVMRLDLGPAPWALC